MLRTHSWSPMRWALLGFCAAIACDRPFGVHGRVVNLEEGETSTWTVELEEGEDTSSQPLNLLQLHREEESQHFWESFSLPFAYAIIGPEGCLVARLLIKVDEQCPSDFVLVLSGGRTKTVPVAVRAEPAVGHGLFFLDGEKFDTMSGVNFTVSNPHPAFDFDDRVCEARVGGDLLSLGVRSAYFSMRGSRQRLSVPMPPASPKHYVTLGDTGLRIKSKNDGWCAEKMGSPKTLYAGKTCPTESLNAAYNASLVDGMFQRAEDVIDPASNGWPFAKVAAKAAQDVHKAKGSAIVVHVGDFTYRHEPCPFPFPTELTPKQQEMQRIFGDCVAVGAKWGDTHAGWVADFFEPAAPLLRAAPWIVFRGNHESCSRGGAGWFRYLDPRPPDAALFEGANTQYPWCVVRTGPYSIEFKDDQWLIVDSNTVTNEEVGIDDYRQEEFTEEDLSKFKGTAVPPMGSDCLEEGNGEGDLWMFDGLRELVVSGKQHWFGIHRPIFGLSFESETDTTSKLYAFQCELANAMRLAEVSVPDVPAIVSGHFHNFELMQYTKRPAQVVLGNGGTQLATPLNGQPERLGRVANEGITLLDEEITYSRIVGEFGYGIISAGCAQSEPKIVAKFLHDWSFAGTGDITMPLPPRTLSVTATFAAGP